MKKTNFKAQHNDKTQKYDLIRFNSVYGSYTEKELNRKGFIIKDGLLYDKEEDK